MISNFTRPRVVTSSRLFSTRNTTTFPFERGRPSFCTQPSETNDAPDPESMTVRTWSRSATFVRTWMTAVDSTCTTIELMTASLNSCGCVSLVCTCFFVSSPLFHSHSSEWCRCLQSPSRLNDLELQSFTICDERRQLKHIYDFFTNSRLDDVSMFLKSSHWNNWCSLEHYVYFSPTAAEFIDCNIFWPTDFFKLSFFTVRFVDFFANIVQVSRVSHRLSRNYTKSSNDG